MHSLCLDHGVPSLPIPYEPERLCVQQTFAYFHINGMFVR